MDLVAFVKDLESGGVSFPEGKLIGFKRKSLGCGRTMVVEDERFDCGRASVAMVLRRSAKGIESLFIKRAHNPKDRWSGHVAFPGGRKEEGENALETCVRECEEEIGLRLTAGGFKVVGRLNDLEVKKGERRGKIRPLVVSVFVFLQVGGPETPSPELTLDPKEIAQAWWVPLEGLGNQPQLELSLKSTAFLKNATLRRLATWVGAEHVHFPCFHLAPPGPELKAQDFPLWGLTLSMVNDFFGKVRHKPLHTSPSFRLDSRATTVLARALMTGRRSGLFLPSLCVLVGAISVGIYSYRRL